MNRFSEIVNDENLPGIKVNIQEIFDKEIVITNYRKLNHSKIKGNSFCLQIQFKYTESSNELYVTFTSSEVLLKQDSSLYTQIITASKSSMHIKE